MTMFGVLIYKRRFGSLKISSSLGTKIFFKSEKPITARSERKLPTDAGLKM